MQSSYKLLAEELYKEIAILQNKIDEKLVLFEAPTPPPKPTPTPGGDPFAYDNPNTVPPNNGYVAGLAGVNADMIVANPSVIAQNADIADQPTVIGQKQFSISTPVKPHYTDNIGLGMGIGLPQDHFDASRDFLGKYGENISVLTQQNDPDEKAYISWKNMNNAVSNYRNQMLKSNLNNWGLYGDMDFTKNFPSGLSDRYNVNVSDLSMRRKLKTTENDIAGTPVKARGGVVNKKISNITKNK
jgi:hypothetical protein